MLKEKGSDRVVKDYSNALAACYLLLLEAASKTHDGGQTKKSEPGAGCDNEDKVSTGGQAND